MIIEGIQSRSAIVIGVVKLGTALDPLFFTIYINSINDAIKHSNIRIFEDISKALKEVGRTGDWTNQVYTLLSEAWKNNMQLNENKFKLIRYSK